MSQAVAQTGVRWRMGARTRKSVLLVHIASAGAWLGIDVVMAVLVFTALCHRRRPHQGPVVPGAGAGARSGRCVTLGLLCLLTGILLGLGSRYGLVRYWWVAVKLALNLVLSGLVLTRPGPGGGRRTPSGPASSTPGAAASLGVGDLIFPPIVSPTALLVAMVLAVFKPWGRIRAANR